jgi:hypothetical protein
VPAPLEIVALLVAATALAAGAARTRISPPLVLTAAGIAASFVPGVPDYPRDPGLVLGGFLPPLLYATAIRTPVRGIRRSARKIALLSVALVLVTAFVVAAVARLALPGLPFDGLSWQVVALCGAVLVAVVLVRVVWVFPALYLPRLLPAVRRAEPVPPGRHVLLVSWAGMRGVVTLAAAAALPAATPQREVLVLAAFTVVAGTLRLQAPTLPLLVRRLGVSGPDPGQDALLQAEVVERATLAGLERLEQVADGEDDAETVENLRSWGRRTARAAWETAGRELPAGDPGGAFRRLRAAMLEAERRVVVDAGRAGDVPHDVLEPVMERLDQEEAMLVGFAESVDADTVEAMTTVPESAACVHLRLADPATQPRTPGTCQGCLELGEREWVHLRYCLACGYVGCCDSSPHKHATAHFEECGHPVIRSQEPGESWRWCYPDQLVG